MAGIRIRHETARSVCHVVPVLALPYDDGGFVCPTCQVLHPCKSVHLWLNDVGECLVSDGVLAELRMAGMPELSVVGSVDDPPPLRIGGGVTREEVDQENRRVQLWAPAREGAPT